MVERTPGLDVGHGVIVPWNELEFRRSRSGGPGGQNVNKVETKVEVRWDLAASPSLDERQRQRLKHALASRLVGEGVLVVKSAVERSQGANRQAALERLAKLIAQALKPRKRRHATAPTASSREKRLQTKRKRAQTKRDRAQTGLED